MSKNKFQIEWRSAYRKAVCAPNPKYPEGIDLDCTDGVGKCCVIPIPYPAEECGTWIIRCRECKFSVGVTAAGRIDDPRSVRVPCKH